jgi:hypothetical protein
MTAAIVVAAIACLCGCGGGGRSDSDVAGSAGSRAGRFAGAGAQPARSVAAENRLPGTLSWRLAPGAAAHGTVEGYVSDQEVAPGSAERFYVDAPRARWVRVELYRMGWYGGLGGRLVLRSPRLQATPQRPCAHDSRTGLTQCDWRATWSVRLPPTLVSGVYTGKLVTSAGAQKDTLLIVRAPHPGAIVAQISTATYEAYNDFGGDDLYPSVLRVGVTGTDQGVEVSFDRPYDSTTGAGQLFARDIAMVRFLEREGYPVTYVTDAGVDANASEVRGARVLLVVGHSEYWSQRAHDAYAAARDAGVNLAFFSSDTMGWRVRYVPAGAGSSEAGRPDHVIVAYKEHAALDPDRSRPTGRFPDGGASITATRYENCITPRLPGGPPPVYRYYAWSPSAALSPGWLFRGTGLTPASSVPGILGYELDRLAPSPPADLVVVGQGRATCQGSQAQSDQAFSTLYRARSGALVFSSGTMGWQLGLSPVPSTSPDAPTSPDPRLVMLTENLLARMLR